MCSKVAASFSTKSAVAWKSGEAHQAGGIKRLRVVIERVFSDFSCCEKKSRALAALELAQALRAWELAGLALAWARLVWERDFQPAHSTLQPQVRDWEVVEQRLGRAQPVSVGWRQVRPRKPVWNSVRSRAACPKGRRPGPKE